MAFHSFGPITANDESYADCCAALQPLVIDGKTAWIPDLSLSVYFIPRALLDTPCRIFHICRMMYRLSFSSSLERHEREFSQPFIIVKLPAACYSGRESSLDTLELLDICDVVRIP